MKKITFVFTAIVAFFSFTSLTLATFKDLQPTDLYYDSINSLADAGVINGYPDGNFIAKNRVNRAEFTKMVIKTLQSDARYSDIFPDDAFLESLVPSEGCFPDVKKTDWYAKYVCFAKSKGMIEGYTDGNFEPNYNISVVEAMKIVFEAVDPNGVEARADDGVWFNKYTYYADDFDLWVDSWLEESEAYQITRGELAEFLEKAIWLHV